MEELVAAPNGGQQRGKLDEIERLVPKQRSNDNSSKEEFSFHTFPAPTSRLGYRSNASWSRDRSRNS
ncbi:Hypothetical predicted protein [Paramuricea clavata]|uniref:Uncharacterized protein n=1 Tax=Paramuricea clavata TaxID=317549 RepID=A0A6S7KQD0_PARCT|nr:Hypothetical predicted protein [Paramuricea clavata]